MWDFAGKKKGNVHRIPEWSHYRQAFDVAKNAA
jgi:hypothetical protein